METILVDDGLLSIGRSGWHSPIKIHRVQWLLVIKGKFSFMHGRYPMAILQIRFCVQRGIAHISSPIKSDVHALYMSWKARAYEMSYSDKVEDKQHDVDLTMSESSQNVSHVQGAPTKCRGH